MYEIGAGVAQDDVAAVKWYRLAADQGYAAAQYNLGIMYANGRGVAQDDAEAVKWYRHAADQGDADAQFNLGLRYANGRGVAQDYAEAVKWYRRAADQGDATARNNLGLMYALGRGVPQDYVQAHMWANLAAAAGAGKAQGLRDWVASKMTPAQIAEAQRLARGHKVGARPTGWHALSIADIKAVQRALSAAGYDAGPADGVIGRRTEAALNAYQRHKGLPIGQPDDATLRALGLR